MTFCGTWRWDNTTVSGGQGQVSFWTNTDTKEKIAIKSFFHHGPASKKEVQLMKKIDFPYIVKTVKAPHDFKNNPTYNCILIKEASLYMEYCSGGTLREMLQSPDNRDGLTENNVVTALTHLSAAIKYLHSENIIHRDIKPENILVQNDARGHNVFKLGDLGIAKDVSNSFAMSPVGTWPYVAPEIVNIFTGNALSKCPDTRYGESVDYWCFGLIAFEMCCGVHPFLPKEVEIRRYRAVEIKADDDIAITMDGITNNCVYHKRFVSETRLSPRFRDDIISWLGPMLLFSKDRRGKFNGENGVEINGLDALHETLTDFSITTNSQNVINTVSEPIQDEVSTTKSPQCSSDSVKKDYTQNIGDWTYQGPLGEGTQGQVSLWKNNKTAKQIAIKSFLHNNKYIQNEIAFMKTSQCRFIVKTVDDPQEIISRAQQPQSTAEYIKSLLPYFITSSLPYVCMEFCSGGTLRQMLQRPENLNGLKEVDVRTVLSHLSQAIQYLHARQIIHRDIKPENIMIQVDENVEVIYKLGDLGLAKDISPDGSLGKTYCGSKHYLAPEICDLISGYVFSKGLVPVAKERYGTSVDYFSFGVIAFEISCGIVPFLPFEEDYYRYAAVQNKTKDTIAITRKDNREMKNHEEFPYKTRLSRQLQTNLTVWLRSMLEFNKESRGKIEIKMNKVQDGFTFLRKILKAKFFTIETPAQTYQILVSEQCSTVQDVLRVLKSTGKCTDDNPWVFTSEGKLLTGNEKIEDYLQMPVYLLKKSNEKIKTDDPISKIIHSTFTVLKTNPDEPLENGTLLWRVAIHDVQKLLERTSTLYNCSVALRKLYVKIVQQPRIDLSSRLFGLNLLIEQEEEWKKCMDSRAESCFAKLKTDRDAVASDMSKFLNSDEICSKLKTIDLNMLENIYDQMLKEHPKWRESLQDPKKPKYDMKIFVKIIGEFFTTQRRIARKIAANIEQLLKELNPPQDDHKPRDAQCHLMELDRLIKQVQEWQRKRKEIFMKLNSLN